MTKYIRFFLFAACLFFLTIVCNARGTWVAVAKPSPNFNNGVMLLLSDGSVLVKSCFGGTDTTGTLWNKLTPDIYGSYVNGTWDTITRMHYTRLYCSSQILKDGRVYVAGGEYGNGGAKGETYDPLTNVWTVNGALPGNHAILDGNSKMLPDGKVLQAYVQSGSRGTYIYDPVTNIYTAGPTALGDHDESAWLKLPDNSILFVDIGSRLSERYIPSLNQWIRDDSVPVSLYDPYGYESGASFLLPDGRAFFIGSPGTTAYYTPSGNTSPGVWTAGPPIPDSMGAPDAAAAMMVNGKILCAFSHVPDSADNFPKPTFFYEFDYLTNTFTRIITPSGQDTLKGSSYETNMLDLPDGNVLFSSLKSDKYYVYVPDGRPLPVGKPVIYNVVKQACDTYMATGVLFNGITEGAAYGDDWQMATNYPLVRLVTHSNVYGDYVYYARTYNWNRTGVMTGDLLDTATFVLPAGLPDGTYDLELVANGNPSDAYPFTTCISSGITQGAPGDYSRLSVYPNPVSEQMNVKFDLQEQGSYLIKLVDVLGRSVEVASGTAVAGVSIVAVDLAGFPKGVYTVVLTKQDGVYATKVVVQ